VIPGLPNMGEPFDLERAQDAARRYRDFTDAEYISDQAQFDQGYKFAAHRSARHLDAALAEIERLKGASP
jgi:hypothetical protein